MKNIKFARNLVQECHSSRGLAQECHSGRDLVQECHSSRGLVQELHDSRGLVQECHSGRGLVQECHSSSGADESRSRSIPRRRKKFQRKLTSLSLQEPSVADLPSVADSDPFSPTKSLSSFENRPQSIGGSDNAISSAGIGRNSGAIDLLAVAEPVRLSLTLPPPRPPLEG